MRLGCCLMRNNFKSIRKLKGLIIMKFGLSNVYKESYFDINLNVFVRKSIAIFFWCCETFGKNWDLLQFELNLWIWFASGLQVNGAKEIGAFRGYRTRIFWSEHQLPLFPPGFPAPAWHQRVENRNTATWNWNWKVGNDKITNRRGKTAGWCSNWEVRVFVGWEICF